MGTKFTINDKVFETQDIGDTFTVRSHPHNYTVTLEPFNIELCDNAVFIIDRNVWDKFYFYKTKTNNIHIIEASEANKNITTVLAVIDKFTSWKITKASTIYAIGGGFVQDIVAFACKIYKRGVPWVFVPTTLLSQVDSCIGGKTALNHEGYKNILGLFSAPKKIIIDKSFLNQLTIDDVFSGMGELYRLVYTGGKTDTSYDCRFALGVKKAIVEADEFEAYDRMSMNYGHTIGHALEAYFDYRVPHGIGVMIGIIVENRLGNARLPTSLRKFESILLAKIVQWDTTFLQNLKHIDQGIFPYLLNDKKTCGNVLTYAYLKKPGQMYFKTMDMTDENKQKILDVFHAVGELNA